MKDELKKKHKIKYDTDKKIWYILSNDDLPEDLNKYKKMFVDVDYNDKDIMKKKYQSLRFDFVEKSWYCSLEDFESMG
jgi:hypothetical protein